MNFFQDRPRLLVDPSLFIGAPVTRSITVTSGNVEIEMRRKKTTARLLTDSLLIIIYYSSVSRARNRAVE